MEGWLLPDLEPIALITSGTTTKSIITRVEFTIEIQIEDYSALVVRYLPFPNSTGDVPHNFPI